MGPTPCATHTLILLSWRFRAIYRIFTSGLSLLKTLHFYISATNIYKYWISKIDCTTCHYRKFQRPRCLKRVLLDWNQRFFLVFIDPKRHIVHGIIWIRKSPWVQHRTKLFSGQGNGRYLEDKDINIWQRLSRLSE